MRVNIACHLGQVHVLALELIAKSRRLRKRICQLPQHAGRHELDQLRIPYALGRTIDIFDLQCRTFGQDIASLDLEALTSITVDGLATDGDQAQKIIRQRKLSGESEVWRIGGRCQDRAGCCAVPGKLAQDGVPLLRIEVATEARCIRRRGKRSDRRLPKLQQCGAADRDIGCDDDLPTEKRGDRSRPEGSTAGAQRIRAPRTELQRELPRWPAGLHHRRCRTVPRPAA